MVKKITQTAITSILIIIAVTIIVFQLIGMAGCKKNETPQKAKDTVQTKTISAGFAANDGMTVLGDKLINPYTVANMETAKRNLAARGIVAPNNFTVRETHLYVKFKPKNEEEYNALEADNALDPVDFPLDYDIKSVGNWYHEPGLADDMPTPQYAIVPAGFSFNSSVEYEVLDRLYIPEMDSDLMGNATNDDYTYLRQLLFETYGINPPNDRFPPIYLEPAQTGDEGGYGGGGADGFVRVFDTRLNNMVPLKGAEILALNGMTFYHGTTDNNGQYWLDNWFQGNSIVLVKMRKNDFTIRKNFLNNANIARPGNGTYLDIDINNGMERMYATMFRAAYRYNYGDVGGLQRPRQPIFKQVLVGADATGTGINNIVWPKIRIWRYSGNGTEYGTDEIFSTTIHELAHTVHVKTMDLGALDYSNLTDQIRESWCVGVEWFITGLEYKEKGIGNYGDWNYNPATPPQFPNQSAYQYWDVASDGPDYTSLFINLVDDRNDANLFFGSPTDNVTGYTLQGIESTILKHVAKTHPGGSPPFNNSLSERLKANKPTGVTDAQIDALLSFY